MSDDPDRPDNDGGAMRRASGRRLVGGGVIAAVLIAAGTALAFVDSHASNPIVGSSADVAAVEAAAPVLVAQNNNLHDLPAATAERVTDVDSPTRMAALRTRVVRIWDPTVAGAELSDLDADLRTRASTPAMEQMLAATVTVRSWQVVHVSGDEAAVTFTADTQRQSATTNTCIDEGRSRFRLTLRRGTDAQWRLLSSVSEALDGQG